jgi:hypothetical protein
VGQLGVRWSRGSARRMDRIQVEQILKRKPVLGVQKPGAMDVGAPVDIKRTNRKVESSPLPGSERL